MGRRPIRALATGAMVATLLTTAACGGGDSGSTSGDAAKNKGTPGKLTMLAWSSSDAENAALQAGIAAFNKLGKDQVQLTISPKYDETLTAALSGGTPPDVFYVDAGKVTEYVKNGVLAEAGDKAEGKDDFYPALKEAFTVDGKNYCAPKDFSTLALQINSDSLAKAGIEAPKTWDELKAAAAKMNTGGQAGLVIAAEWARVGAFMRGAGGWIVNDDGTKMDAKSDANKTALEFVQGLFADGVAKTPQDVGAGWAGEAFGKKKAAMVIEGNWITGALKKDFPDVKYTVVPMPEGPNGKGTLAFTVCYGVAAKSGNQAGGQALVDFLTSKEQQLAFTKDFGVIPSRQSAKDEWLANNKTLQPYADSAEFAKVPVFAPGFTKVLDEFNAGLQNLAKKKTTPDQLLDELDSNGSAIVGG